MTQLEKIMLVEDEQDIQTIAKFSLERIGQFHVKYCSSGKDALTSFEDFKPQLILLDIMMPDMDGVTTFQKLAVLPEFKRTMVVFMTAKVQPNEVEQYIALGAVDVISKPFNPKALPDQLRKIWQCNEAKLV